MANQIKPPTPLATEEFKEVNRENYKDCFDLSQKEVSRLTAVNREFILKSEKQSKKLEEKKVELETEKIHLLTYRELVQVLNAKIIQLENATTHEKNPLETHLNTELLTGDITENSSSSISGEHQLGELEYQNVININCLLNAKDKQISDLKIQILSLQERHERKDSQIEELSDEVEQLRSDIVDLDNVRSLLQTQLSSDSNRASTLDRNYGILRPESHTQARWSIASFLAPSDEGIFSNLRRSRSNQDSNPPELTPPIVPIPNTTGKSSSRTQLRPGLVVNTLKLKVLPSPREHLTNQIICRINKRFELGVLMAIFEAPNIFNRKVVTASYVGMQLYNPVGDSNGEFRGKRFFECGPNYGIFVPFEDVLVPVL